MKTAILWTIFFSLVFWSLYGFAQAKFSAVYAAQDLRNAQIVQMLDGK